MRVLLVTTRIDDITFFLESQGKPSFDTTLASVVDPTNELCYTLGPAKQLEKPVDVVKVKKTGFPSLIIYHPLSSPGLNGRPQVGKKLSLKRWSFQPQDIFFF